MSATRPVGRAGRWQWELLLIAVLYLAYDGSRLLVGGNLGHAVRDARGMLDLERRFHLDPEHWLNSLFSSHAWLGIPADYAYASLHYLVTPAVLIWIWRRHRPAYRQARTWICVTTLLALAGFVLFPAAPPRLLPASYGFTDTMAQHASIGWWSGAGSAPKGLGPLTNELAAMPSLHVGWALWCGLLLFRHARSRTVRTLGLLYPVVITLVVMGTGNHYLLDCVAGALLLGVGALVTRPLLRLADTLEPRLPRITDRSGLTGLPSRVLRSHRVLGSHRSLPDSAPPTPVSARTPARTLTKTAAADRRKVDHPPAAGQLPSVRTGPATQLPSVKEPAPALH